MHVHISFFVALSGGDEDAQGYAGALFLILFGSYLFSLTGASGSWSCLSHFTVETFTSQPLGWHPRRGRAFGEVSVCLVDSHPPVQLK